MCLYPSGKATLFSLVMQDPDPKGADVVNVNVVMIITKAINLMLVIKKDNIQFSTFLCRRYSECTA